MRFAQASRADCRCDRVLARNDLRRPGALIITAFAVAEVAYRLLRKPVRRTLEGRYSGVSPAVRAGVARNGSRPRPPRFP